MNRRSFLKVLGGTGLSIVAAPLFIPSERLDFGVPRGPIALPTEEEVAEILAVSEQPLTIGTWSYTAFAVDTASAADFIPEIWSKYAKGMAGQDLVFSKLMAKSNIRDLIWHGASVRLPAVSRKALA
ncbi:MAG TPA: hypothetical protein VMT30_09220 [Candidatus Saccharimonadia bacterium]|nr:hypothetical protein [Candidatus Saccharimonadia bacterium]